MKPVIIHVVQHLKPGGIESFTLEFQRAAAPFFDVHIISLEQCCFQHFKQNQDEFGGFIHSLNKKPGWRLDTILQLKNLIRILNPFYVHTHHIGPLIYGGLAARLARIKNIVHTEHDAWHLEDVKRRHLQELFLKLIKPIYVADAKFVAEQVKMHLPFAEPIVIANGVDTEKFKPSSINKKSLLEHKNLPTHLKYIGCAARLESVKSHDVLIRALQLLPENIGLLLAGTGSLQSELEHLVSELSLDRRVFFLGHIENMQLFYPLLKVFCLSSSCEGLPLSPLEAQACDIPVVLTNVGGCKEAICKHTGAVVQPNNPNLLSQALLSSLSGNTDASPRKFVKSERSIRNMIHQYISLTQMTLNGRL